MALRALGDRLQAEVTCPLCLELFSQPVLAPCGHSLCSSCSRLLLGSPPGPAPCPQCRASIQPGSLRPNFPLGAVAELAAALDEAAGEEATRPRCPEHGEILGLFCISCRRLLCAVCRQHRTDCGHRALPAEQAAGTMRETLQSNLAFLEKEKEEFNPKGETRINMLMGTVASEQQKLRAAFEQLQQFLREQEGSLLAQLNGMHARLTEQHQEYTCRAAERRALLEELLVEIPRKREQPAVEFLQDVAGILDRCMEAKVPIPEPVSPELQRGVSNLCKASEQVLAVLADFRVNLLSKLDTERVKVLLDLETASPYLSISSDCRTLQIAEEHQNLPDTPKRFTGSASVLGSQGFTAGRHYWELEVGGGNTWAVGVALESVQRKESLVMAMEKIWALRMDWDGSYTALTMPPTQLSLQEEPRRIRVHLDYEAGQVTFYNTDNMRQILQFNVSFSEKVFPYFWLWTPGTHIKLCS
ncbi:E3 ubiquitin-protein ligase TRIM7-like isoform X2 [Coturnix japonica]|uniref:E3 ubiquitin-protein ligase TRIM7-like isoform X2 n=1 Tax=Coturnix japonica TaxID=93934 RepID=UPI000778070A|nr:E3 ubiquitin-protein ligase TRIM7-like isoform X2 [Coturnix japonica]